MPGSVDRRLRLLAAAGLFSAAAYLLHAHGRSEQDGDFCGACKPGESVVDAARGGCRQHCSPAGFCGTSEAYRHIDCRGLFQSPELMSIKAAGWRQPTRVPAKIVTAAQVSAAASACSPAEVHVLVAKQLPASILEDGLSLFGSCAGLAAVVSRVSAPTEVSVVDGMLSIELRAFGSDATLKETGSEMEEDRYSLTGHHSELAAAAKSVAHPGITVDVGANIGDFSVSAWLANSATQVLSFEPGAETFFAVLWNMAANSVPRLTMDDLGKPGKFGVIATHGALTEDGKDVTFYHNPLRSQISAVARDGFALPDGWTKRVTPTFNLGQTLDQHNVAVVHKLKIDCEGCEFDILGGLFAWVSDSEKVRHIEGEIHWHLACPNQFADQVKHVSRAAAESARDALAARGCRDLDGRDIATQHRLGFEWGGDPLTDVAITIRC